MSVTHPTTTLDQAQRALDDAVLVLAAIGETLNVKRQTTVWETVAVRLSAHEPALDEDNDRRLCPGERIIGGRRYYSAAWL